MAGAFTILFVAIFVVMFAGAALGVVFWVVKLIEVVQIPAAQFRAAGTEKLPWVLIVGLASYMGAIIWYFSKRDEVLSAAGDRPPQPGWYAHPSTGALRFWDGIRWTDAAPNPPPL